MQTSVYCETCGKLKAVTSATEKGLELAAWLIHTEGCICCRRVKAKLAAQRAEAERQQPNAPPP